MGSFFSWHKKHVEKYELLGRGAFGSVYLVNYPVYTQKYAVKVVNIPDQETARQAMKEEFTLRHLNGQSNMVEIFSAEMSPDQALLIWMEYCDLGDLNSYVLQNLIYDKTVIALMDQLCDAVIYVHAQFVIYKDIKPANILLKSHWISFMGPQLKLGDFGFEMFAASIDYFNEIYLSVRTSRDQFMAPEVREGREYTGAADVYSMGEVLKFLNSELEDSTTAKMRIVLGELAKQMTRHDPNGRPDETTVKAQLNAI